MTDKCVYCGRPTLEDSDFCERCFSLAQMIEQTPEQVVAKIWLKVRADEDKREADNAKQ